VNARTLNVHRCGKHVFAIKCDPQAIGWVIADDVGPFTLEPGDRLDLAVTFIPRTPMDDVVESIPEQRS